MIRIGIFCMLRIFQKKTISSKKHGNVHWNNNPDHSILSLYFHTGISKKKKKNFLLSVFLRLPKMPLEGLLFLDLRFPSEFFQLLPQPSTQCLPTIDPWDGVKWRERRGRKRWAFFKRSFSLDKSWHGETFLHWNSLYRISVRILPIWWLKSASDHCLWCFLYLYSRFCFLPVTIGKAWRDASVLCWWRIWDIKLSFNCHLLRNAKRE